MILIVAAFLLISGATPKVEAQTCAPSADYRFQGTRSSFVGTAPALTDIGTGGNSFAIDTVDGASRSVLQFPQGNGVQLQPTTGTIANDAYTIVVLFKFADVSNFRRILDFKNGTSDTGLYVLNGNLIFYNVAATGSGAPIAANTYVQVVLTRNATGTVTGYVNGAQQFSFNDSTSNAVIDSNNALRFFKDNISGGATGEESAGSVARIRLYNCVLTASEVAALDQAPAAQPLTVTRTDDRNATCLTGDCSLREAVNAANTAGTNDTINFAIPAGNAGCASGVCTITLTVGELTVNSTATAGTLTITNSTGASNLLISGNNTRRVFFVNTGANLTINGVTITKGNGMGTTVNGYGGGIFNSGTLTLTNSIVSSNMAFYNGGGILNESSGTLTLTNSTVSGNTGTFGGGILNDGTLTFTNSTISGNTASTNGGGIFNEGVGTINLTSVTVTRNKSTLTSSCPICAGGIRNLATATLYNTIVAVNTVANADSSPDFGGAVVATSSYNLIGNGFGTTGISNGDGNHNQVGFDPNLDPTLQLNGGTTPNHALLFGSPAIDKGNSFGLMTDQRGFARPVDLATYTNAADGSDIGAFEVQLGSTAATVSIGGRVTTADGRGITNVLLTLTDSQGSVKTTVSAESGYYRFDDVEAGSTYIITATGKRFSFNQPTQVHFVTEEREDINFTALPGFSKRIRL